MEIAMTAFWQRWQVHGSILPPVTMFSATALCCQALPGGVTFKPGL